MKSRLAEDLRREQLEAVRRMTAEQRLAAYAEHCRLLAGLRRAGAEARAQGTLPPQRNED